MATTKPVTAKLRLRLEIIAALPESILLERLRRLSKAELIAFRRSYGIRECRCKAHCKIRQKFLTATAAKVAARGMSRRRAARLLRELRDTPMSMYQSRCHCSACQQPVPPIPFSAHQLLAALLTVPEGESKPHRPRARPNRNRGLPRRAA